jgi:AcrR family transcriptional regulator
MDSQKSTPNSAEAKAPRRARGHARVASLLEAAGAEFAERGYEATTMTAIAARAASSIGSLYQFFPTKEQVAGTLIEQYLAELEAMFERLREEASSLDVSVIAARLTTMFVVFRTRYPAFVALAEVQEVVLPDARGVRERLRTAIASVLSALAPQLSTQELLLRAAIVQHLMKAAVTLSHDASVADPQAAMLEFQRVAQHYLEDVVEAGHRGKTERAPQGRGGTRKRHNTSDNEAGATRKGGKSNNAPVKD